MIGAILCKTEALAGGSRRAYIGMLAVEAEMRRYKIGSALASTAITRLAADCDEVRAWGGLPPISRSGCCQRPRLPQPRACAPPAADRVGDGGHQHRGTAAVREPRFRAGQAAAQVLPERQRCIPAQVLGAVLTLRACLIVGVFNLQVEFTEFTQSQSTATWGECWPRHRHHARSTMGVSALLDAIEVIEGEERRRRPLPGGLLLLDGSGTTTCIIISRWLGRSAAGRNAGRGSGPARVHERYAFGSTRGGSSTSYTLLLRRSCTLGGTGACCTGSMRALWHRAVARRSTHGCCCLGSGFHLSISSVTRSRHHAARRRGARPSLRTGLGRLLRRWRRRQQRCRQAEVVVVIIVCRL